MDFPVILAIIGIIVSAMVPLTGYFWKSRRELKQYYSVIWKRSSALREKDVLGERPFNEYYFEREEDAILKRCLERHSNVLLVGPPLIGKTRAVYEQLHNLRKKVPVLIPRSISMQNYVFPYGGSKKGKGIIFVDDLQNFVEKQNNFHFLFKTAKEKNLAVVATCQSGQEYKKVCNKMIEQNLDVDLLFGSGIIEYERITPETGKQIAQKLGINWDASKFNGTIGSVFMKLSEMERRYSSCTIIEKTIMQSLRMMNTAGLFSENGLYDMGWLKLTASSRELQGKDFEWSAWLKSLEDKELIRIVHKHKLWAEEAYLQSVVRLQTNVNDYDVFDEMTETFKDQPDALIQIGTRAYDFGSVDINVADYMKAVISAFSTVLQTVPAENARLIVQSYEYRGLAYWRLSNFGDVAGNNIKALADFKEAIKLTDKSENPEDYAMMQNMLGNSYSALAAVQDTEKNCLEAIRLFKDSLEFFTPGTMPNRYAQACINLGAVYLILGQAKEPVINYRNAITYLKKSLEVISPEREPRMYADAMNNLGNTYNTLSESENKTENLKLALECFTNFCKLFSKEKNPLAYSLGLTNLGSIYCNLAYIEDTEKNCEKALGYLSDALEIRKPEKFPIQFAYVQYWIGITNLALTGHRQSTEFCYRSLEAFEQSLSIKTWESHPFHYAFSHEGLGDAYILLAELNEDKSENYRKSLAAYDEALTVFTETKAPFLHNQIQEKITKAKKIFF